MTAFHMPCHELLSPRNVAVGEFVILDAHRQSQMSAQLTKRHISTMTDWIFKP